MVALIEDTHENAGSAESNLHWSGLPILVELGETGGMLPKEIFFYKFDVLRWLFDGMVTEFASRRTKASQCFVTLDLIPTNARQEYVAIALTI